MTRAELAKLPQPSQDRPVFYEYPMGPAGIERTLVYSFRDCEGRKSDANLTVPEADLSNRKRSQSQGELCGGKPYQFTYLTIRYDLVADFLARGLAEDGYGGKLPVPKSVAHVMLPSGADFYAIQKMAQMPTASLGPAGSPTPAEIAKIYATSFVDHHHAAPQLIKMGVLRKPFPRSGGYGVIYDADGPSDLMGPIRQVTGDLWLESYGFYVDEDQPPQCSAVKTGLECKFRYSMRADVSNFASNIVRNILRGGYESRYEQEQKMRAEAARSGFNWESQTVTLTKAASGEWRSSQIDVRMKRLAETVEAMRATAARGASNGSSGTGSNGQSGPTVGDKCRSEALQMMQYGDFGEAAAKSTFCGM